MRLLVTGAAGFIGSKVVELLLSDGHEVIGLDNLNDAYDVRLKQWRLRRLEGRQGFRFFKGDITDTGVLRDAVGLSLAHPPFDAVINLAARAGVRQSMADPQGYHQTNLTGVLNLLDLCRTSGIPKLVQASTSSVYGDGPQPFREDSMTDRPLSPYAASKKSSELACYVYHRMYGLDISILRYFTVFGPAGRPDMSLFRFVQWISEGRPVTLFGDGSQRRDFTYVDDVARGTVAAVAPVGFEIINLGSDRPVVLNDAITLIEDLVGKKASIQHEPPHPADVRATWADISRAARILKWRPLVSFQDGVAHLVRWYQEQRTWAKDIQT